MLALHNALYTTLLMLTGGLTVWAFFLLITGRPIDGAYRSTYVLMIGAAIGQGIVGIVMLLEGLRPGQSFHFLYGISLVVFTGFGYAWATRGDARRETVTLAVAALAAFGLILRAAATAH
ncbi:MAG: hypothetical protein V9F06_10500 [Thermomicrobiales bacterium]|jgi:heme A synthase